MSGLEALSALGLACNIFQVISFGRETLILVKGVYQNGTIDDSVMDKSTAIKDVASDIIAVDIPRPLGKHEQKLVDVTKKCTGVARDLHEEIAFLLGHNAKGSLRATVRTAVKANWRKRRLERMEKDLDDSEQVMQNALLAWIFKSLNTASLDIDSLEDKMRDFVVKYEQGCRQASELVSEEALQVREVIIRESGKTEMAIRAHVTQVSANAEQRFEHHIEQASRGMHQEKLLQSLKYLGMNERAHQIEDAHARTFRWLFADADNLSNRNDKHKYEGSRMAWDSFTDWLQSDLSIYWIMGKPGSGKSTLAKFILSEPRTKAALEKWHQDVLIASHYFWRPGGMLQRNIKGMLCSIVYQLIIAIPNALEYASTNTDELAQKDNDTDWSVPELQQLCLGLIRHCGKPLCLVIDGLDECGPEDDHQRLLETLERIRLHNVKIIASSRNEPIFERRFRHEPQVRMQDLMGRDLRTYANGMLRQEIRNDISFFNELVEKAEGVFLWLVLAVKSINRGFDSGEPLAELHIRMQSLPKRLNDLYKDMWERLNDDADLYRRDAALYFRLVIAAQDNKLELRCIKHGLSTMEIMLASFDQNHYTFERSPVLSASQLLEECEGFRKRVEVRCAGLLQGYGKSTEFVQSRLGATESTLLDYADKTVEFRFVHRSAYDFLVDTVEGQNILGHFGISSDDLNVRILGASLRTAELLFLMLGKAKELHATHYKYPPQYVDDYIDDLSRIADARDSAAKALFSLCYELYSSSGLLMSLWRTQPTRIAAFFGVAAGYPNLNRCSISVIEKKLIGNGIRSAVLSSVLATPHKGNLPIQLARRLLRLPEIDINLKSPLLVFSPHMVLPVFFTLEDIGPLDHIKASPFTRLLGLGLQGSGRGMTDRRRMAQILQLISDFVLQGADLRSTLFLIIDLQALENLPEDITLARSQVLRSLLPIPEWNVNQVEWTGLHGDKDQCVVAFQATTIIQAMLDNMSKTDLNHDSIDKDEYNSSEDESGFSDVEMAISFLSHKCREYGDEANDRVIGFLQPHGNFPDMPYRQVSDQDSANLVEMIRSCLSEHGVHWNDLAIMGREVVARSPFSSIGFRDFLKNLGCFDEFAAYELLLEWREEKKGYIDCD